MQLNIQRIMIYGLFLPTIALSYPPRYFIEQEPKEGYFQKNQTIVRHYEKPFFNPSAIPPYNPQIPNPQYQQSTMNMPQNTPMYHAMAPNTQPQAPNPQIPPQQPTSQLPNPQAPQQPPQQPTKTTIFSSECITVCPIPQMQR